VHEHPQPEDQLEEVLNLLNGRILGVRTIFDALDEFLNDVDCSLELQDPQNFEIVKTWHRVVGK
jgi:hypothetical protein